MSTRAELGYSLSDDYPMSYDYIVTLEAENATFKQRLEICHRDIQALMASTDTLEAENATLKQEREDDKSAFEQIAINYMRLRDLLPRPDRDEPLTQQECEAAITSIEAECDRLRQALERAHEFVVGDGSDLEAAIEAALWPNRSIARGAVLSLSETEEGVIGPLTEKSE